MNEWTNQSVNQSAKSVSQQCTDVQSSTFRGSDSADAVESQLLRYSLHQHGLYTNSNCIFVCFCVMSCLWRNKRWITLNINLPHVNGTVTHPKIVQFSSVQFARITWCWVQVTYWRSCRWNRKVFGSRRNEERDGAEVTLDIQNAFYARAPATGNALSPGEDRRVAGTTTSVLGTGRWWWLIYHNAMVSPITHPCILIFL